MDEQRFANLKEQYLEISKSIEDDEDLLSELLDKIFKSKDNDYFNVDIREQYMNLAEQVSKREADRKNILDEITECVKSRSK